MFSLCGCGMQKLDGDGMVYKPAYVSISQEEVKLMMKDDDGHVIVDVRRADEYAQGVFCKAFLDNVYFYFATNRFKESIDLR